jgi:hypothetical protein
VGIVVDDHAAATAFFVELGLKLLGRSFRRRARPLSGRSINMRIDLLTQILAVAVDHGLSQLAVRGRPRQDRRRHARGRHAAAAPRDPHRAQSREREDWARRPRIRSREM